MSKTKLLIVNGNLAQAGSERWIYEICKHIDKEKFEVGVLCYKKYVKDNGSLNYNNYYYLKLKELNVSLHEQFPSAADRPTYFERGINKIRRVIYQIIHKTNLYVNPQIIKLFHLYDVICIVDWNYYRIIKNEVHQIPSDKVAIALLCHKFQFDSDPYVWFDKNRKYNFIHFCPKQVEDLFSSNIDVEKNTLFHYPLVMDLSGYPYIYNPIFNNTVTISVFTRISKMKPIDVFIEAFARLSEHSATKLILNIYGDIQDEAYFQQLQTLIESFKVKETVRFMGHSSDMAESVRKDKINLYWGLSIGSSVGFSSIELGAMGIPSVFWSVDENQDFIDAAKQTDGAIPAYNQIDDFVNANLIYVSDNDLLSQLSVKQRNYFTDRHNIEKKIKSFEAFISSLKQA